MDEPTTAAQPPCRKCRGGRETYWYYLGHEFDVDRARQLVADGREPVEVEEESVRDSLKWSQLDEGHVDHVNPAIPGVIAHVRYVTEQGEALRGHLLIDGHHRAARCRRDGRPFLAYLLTEEESEAILLRGQLPPGTPRLTKHPSEA
jgi:hypothetical protein